MNSGIVYSQSNIRHIFHKFSSSKIEELLKFVGLFTSVQTGHCVACKEPNINMLRLRHEATSTLNFQFSHCLTFLRFMEKHFKTDAAFRRNVILHAETCTVCLQWMHFLAISLTESELGSGIKSLI
jgi:hypothetical protein